VTQTCQHLAFEFSDDEWTCTSCFAPLVRLPLSVRPTVWVDSGDLAVQADEAWGALSEWSRRHDDPRVLVKNGVLVRATERDLEIYDRYSLREESSRSCKFSRMTRTGAPNPVYPPMEIMDSLLRRDPREYYGTPRVTAVVDVPVVSPEGELVTEPGIHASGLYYRPDPGLGSVATGQIEIESVDDVRQARDLLMYDLLGDFDFQTEESRANALGLVLLPFVRHLIGDDPTPLHVVDAPQAGSGKTYLTQACLIPGCGLVGLAPEPRDDDELRKLITSSLLSARPALVFDNVGSRMASGTLASALTSRVWQDRILGQSKEVSLPVRCIWVTTGNNWDAAHELVDRICPIQLQPRGEVARHRGPSSFAHSDLHGWAIRNRSRLVQACLTLIQHWLAGEARLTVDGTFSRRETRHRSTASLGSFERWADVIGGILAACDVSGFLENLEDARLHMDFEEQETRDFLLAWRGAFGDREITSNELGQACQLGGALADSLPSTVSPRNVLQSLRYWLRSHKGQRHGSLSLVGSTESGVARRWRVEEVR
jgi:hypothetical protein